MTSFFVRFGSRVVCLSKNFGTSATRSKGHSKWDNIKDTKGKKDAERSKLINQYLEKLKNITADGFDPKLNKKLLNLQLEYKKNSLPMDTFNKRLEKLKVLLLLLFIASNYSGIQSKGCCFVCRKMAINKRVRRVKTSPQHTE